MIRRRASRLDDENILAADIFLDFDEGFAIGKRLDGGLAQLHADGGANRFGKRAVRCAAKNLHNSFVLSLK